MVIGHVLHRLTRAGAEVLAAALARQLQRRFGFVFFCLDGGGPLAEQLRGEGFAVEELGRRPGLDWGVARRLRAGCDRHGVEVLHAHQYTPFFYSAVSRGLMRGRSRGRRGPRILFTEHGRHYPDERKRRRVWANRLLLRRGDAVTAVGEFVKQALVRNEGIAARRIEVIHNGIDVARFARPRDAVAADRAAARAAWGVRDGEVVALQVARFHPVKDHATALRAVAAVPGVVLVLAGEGEERAGIARLAAELGVGERVRFLGVREDVPALLAGADLFVLSSVSEGISVTLLEAMAAGLAVAATDVGGNGEVVAHGVTGLLSPRGDAGALGEHVRRLAGDAALRRALGDAGLQRVQRLFTEQRMHAAYAAVYDRLGQG